MRILIVEDDITSRLYIEKVLEKQGVCDTAANGVEAIDKLMDAITAGTYYDLICLDIMMPKVDGIKVLKTLREMEKASIGLQPAKVIMVTALGDKETLEEAHEAGCEAYAQKPIDKNNLLEVIRGLGLQITD